ncbi:hypothetical protein B7494_g1535 [Chlorociboria aeruginascens]|nr:hypothetical protein B7494_g1535 [Chlorociboria aeruginascens]
MVSSYYSLPQSRNDFTEPPSLLSRIIASLPGGVTAQMHRLWDRHSSDPVLSYTHRVSRSLRQTRWTWNPRQLLSLPHLFVAIWVAILLWGERWVFESSIKACDWKTWERWPKEATPHHLVFLADPQLIDPHSYPDRPWPLSTLTILHVDNYLKRSYIQLSKTLHPDTLFFLGDLFDGGREWKTAHGSTQDPSWANGLRPSGEQKHVESWGKRYGEDFWLREYDRFGKIFFDFWNLGGDQPGAWQRGRKIITSLPGNHDLGFGDQIKIPVRNRFEVYFGEGNRVDVIGNHTFVSVDSVSLSAGSSNRPKEETKEIAKPVEEFLANVQVTKRKAVARELSFQAGEEKYLQYDHKVEDSDSADYSHLPTLDPGASGADLPTILLTHVPLNRPVGMPCGPNREHWPPSPPPKGQNGPVYPDERNAITIAKGYQYQNVLSEEDSIKLVSSVGNVVSVFSGDDHDYCEITHPANKNNAREITVKSMSWAMGVRRPGFLMMSMWNPIGPDGQPLHYSSTGHGALDTHTSTTTESHLCLLPDQLSIFIRYGLLLAFTLITLIIRAITVPILNLPRFSSVPLDYELESILPSTNKDLKQRESRDIDHKSSNSSTSSTSSNLGSNLAPRSSAVRTRSGSPANGYGLPSSQVRNATPPLVNSASYIGNGSGNAERWSREEDFGRGRKIYDSVIGRPRKESPLGVIWREIWMSIWRVAWLVGGVYLYLVKWG